MANKASGVFGGGGCLISRPITVTCGQTVREDVTAFAVYYAQSGVNLGDS